MSLPYQDGRLRPQETLIAEALVERLSLLHRSRGLFLAHVGELPAMPSRLRDDAWDSMLQRLRGQAPAALVVLDAARTTEGDNTWRVWHRMYDVTVAVFSTHRRDLVLGRLDPDMRSLAEDARDPGMRAMCELIDTLVLGWKLDVPGVYEMRPGNQGMQTVYAGAAGTLRELHYQVLAELRRGDWPEPARYIESIHTQLGPHGLALTTEVT